MDEGLKKVARGIEVFGLWFRLSIMLALALACLLALRSLRTKKEIAAANAVMGVEAQHGSVDELESLLGAELPMKFAEIIIQGRVSEATAVDLYRQHRARFEVRNWRYDPTSSRYSASIRLSWQPDATPGPGEDFWVIAQCSASRHSSARIGFEVRRASPDYVRACQDYFNCIMKKLPMR